MHSQDPPAATRYRGSRHDALAADKFCFFSFLHRHGVATSGRPEAKGEGLQEELH